MYSGIVLYRLVLLRLSTYFLLQVRIRYVLFIPSTYRVRTSRISMYLVRTEYRNHDKSTCFRLQVQTFHVTYQYIQVRTEYILLCLLLYRLFVILKGYMLTLVEYILWNPDSIARPPARPAGLLASDSGTCPRIEPNHTQALAGLFTAAWQRPCQCLSAWARALAACWGIQLRRVSFTLFAAAMISCLLTSRPSPSQQRCARCKRACEGLWLQVGASMMS